MVKKVKIYNFLKRPLGNRNDKCVNLFEAVKVFFFNSILLQTPAFMISLHDT